MLILHKWGILALTEDYTCYDKTVIETNAVRCPDPDVAGKMIDYIASVKAEGDTVGGIITGVIKGVPAGLGEPVFDKLQARLGFAMLGINAVKGFEYGVGFEGAGKKGSEIIDSFTSENGQITTRTNYSGGIQGGISNGADIYFRVVFKPVATLLKDVNTVDKAGNDVVLHAKGRHDPCVLPRAVPIVEAMAAITILDSYLLNKTVKL